MTNYGLKRLKGSMHDSAYTYSVYVVIVIIGYIGSIGIEHVWILSKSEYHNVK
jgi:hypothetical protein